MISVSKGLKSIVAIVAVIVVVVGVVIFKKETENDPEVPGNTTKPTSQVQSEDDIDLESVKILQSEEYVLPNGYFYNQLDENGKSLYTQILNDVQSDRYDTEVTGDCELTKLDDAYESVFLDHPEFFWAYGSCYSLPTYGTYGPSARVYIRVYPFFGETSDEVSNQKKQVLDKVKEICYKAQKCSTDYEKALLVHDYIVDHTRFNEQPTGNHEDETAYGCLVKKEATAYGLAAAYTLVLKNLGIDCMQKSGYVVVLLDGEPYAVSLKDDIMCQCDKHEGCFIQSDGIKYWPNELPQCKSMKYNYYVYNGWYIEGDCSYDKLQAMIAKQEGNSVQYLKFDSEDNMRLAYKALSGNTGKSVSYSSNAYLIVLRND